MTEIKDEDTKQRQKAMIQGGEKNIEIKGRDK